MTRQRALFIGLEFITVAVDRDIEAVIREWEHDHFQDLKARLAPLGFDADYLRQPDYRRLVLVDDEEVVQAAIDSGEVVRKRASGGS